MRQSNGGREEEEEKKKKRHQATAASSHFYEEVRHEVSRPSTSKKKTREKHVGFVSSFMSGSFPCQVAGVPFTVRFQGWQCCATFWAPQRLLKPTLSDRDAASFRGAIGAALLTPTQPTLVLSDVSVRQSAAAGAASRQNWTFLSFSTVPDELRDAETPCCDWAGPSWPASTRNASGGPSP